MNVAYIKGLFVYLDNIIHPHLDLVLIKPLFLNQLGFHPLGCRLGIPQVVLQFLKEVKLQR